MRRTRAQKIEHLAVPPREQAIPGYTHSQAGKRVKTSININNTVQHGEETAVSRRDGHHGSVSMLSTRRVLLVLVLVLFHVPVYTLVTAQNSVMLVYNERGVWHAVQEGGTRNTIISNATAQRAHHTSTSTLHR